MTAPERIWAWEQPGGLGSVRGWRPVVGSSDWSNNSTEYIRADLVADQIRAAVQAERAWQPMNTAPKDGVEFLAMNYDGKIHQAQIAAGYVWSINSGSCLSATGWMPLPAIRHR